jgi:uncharacterized protein YkwD
VSRPFRPCSITWLLALSACGGGEVPAPPLAPLAADSTCGLGHYREDALRLINARRAAGASCGDHGEFAPVAPLAWNDRLERAAFGHSADMAAKDYFSHTGADGAGFAMRIDASGYRWSMIAENIAAGPLDVASTIDGWMASPGHCANLMAAGLRDMGLACAEDPDSTYGRYLTLDLGAPR